ncbi:solute carrier family 2, facilitated glucose transporter member 6 [Tachysurus ichikawai]
MTGITPILVYMEPIFEKTAVSLFCANRSLHDCSGGIWTLCTVSVLWCSLRSEHHIQTPKCVPEPKGRSLEEIENCFKTGHTFTILET